jgi:hypothetical protein
MRVTATALRQSALFIGAVAWVAGSFVLAAHRIGYGLAGDFVLAGYLGWRERRRGRHRH